jgi:hypothetical protein
LLSPFFCEVLHFEPLGFSDISILSAFKCPWNVSFNLIQAEENTPQTQTPPSIAGREIPLEQVEECRYI